MSILNLPIYSQETYRKGANSILGLISFWFQISSVEMVRLFTHTPSTSVMSGRNSVVTTQWTVHDLRKISSLCLCTLQTCSINQQSMQQYTRNERECRLEKWFKMVLLIYHLSLMLLHFIFSSFIFSLISPGPGAAGEISWGISWAIRSLFLCFVKAEKLLSFCEFSVVTVSLLHNIRAQ